MYCTILWHSVDDSSASIGRGYQLRNDGLNVLPKLSRLSQEGVGFEKLLWIRKIALRLDLVV
jgi:hypothetical protein